MAELRNWDMFEKNVQSGITEGQFINSGTCVLGAGPSFLSGSPTFTGPSDQRPGSGSDSSEGDSIFLIGMVNQWSVQQSMMVIPVPEAGSYRMYNITGPVSGQIQLSRTLIHGPSLLRCIQGHRRITDPRSAGGRIESLVRPGASEFRGFPQSRISDPPGYENGFFNLASSFFTQPSGLLIYMADVAREGYAAVYCEQFLPSNHGLGSGPGSMVVSEQVSGPIARVRSVKLAKAVPLLSKPDNAGRIGIAGTENTIPSASPQFLDIQTQSNR